MNLDTCTPGQRQIITTLNKPLMVSAGAGSGKTFTLTQRIAYALSEDTPDAQPVQSISQIMAMRLPTSSSTISKYDSKFIFTPEALRANPVTSSMDESNEPAIDLAGSLAL